MMKRSVSMLLGLGLASGLGLMQAEPAQASGYGLREHSAAVMGNATAGGVAGAEDITYSFFNPATAARLDGHQAAAVVTYIHTRSRFRRAEGTTAAGTPAGGGRGGSDVLANPVIPALYAMTSPTEDLRLALSITAPWGLETDYDRDWAGRYHALHTKLETVNINPMVAYRFSPRLQVGAGLQLQYMRAKLSEAIDFGTIGALFQVPGAVPGTQDGRVRLHANGWAVGGNLGLLFEPVEDLRLGLAYRSAMRHTLKGRARFDLDDAGVGAALSAGGAFQGTDMRARLTTPESVVGGFHYDVSTQWSVMGQAEWTRWSRFNKLRIRFDNPAQDDALSEQRWRDSWFFALGATWRPSPEWTLRAGIAHDFTPIPNRTRTPRIPDADRTWLSFGVGYQPLPGVSLDAGYTHLFMPNAKVDLRADQPGNAARGDFSGRSSTSVHIVSLQLRLSF